MLVFFKFINIAVDEAFILNNPIKFYKKFSIPLVFFAIFSAGYSFMDLVWAGLMGKNVLIAVGLSAPIFLVISNLGRNIGKGSNAVMSWFQGAYDLENTTNTLLHGILICIVVSVIIPIIIITGIEDLLVIMNISSQLPLFLAIYILFLYFHLFSYFHYFFQKH